MAWRKLGKNRLELPDSVWEVPALTARTGAPVDFPMDPSSIPPSSQVAIPEALRLQLNDFRRHLWRVKLLEAVAAGFIGLLVSFLLVYGLDRFFPTPGWVRLGILLAGFSLFAGFAPYWLHRWVWRRRREDQLARLIAKRYPGLGDRLLGVIELQNQAGNADTLSPRLREAAMAAVAAEAGKRTLAEALPPQRHRRWALAALGLAGISAAVLTLTPRAGWNAFQRWLMPLSKTERYTFAKLDHAPRKIWVPFGEAFSISLKLAEESEQKPASGTGRYGQQPTVAAPLRKGRYQFDFPGQQDLGTVVFRIGDLRHELLVEPVQRPGVLASQAIVSSPDYLQIPPRKVDLTTGVASAVEGSRVTISLTMTRALDGGKFGPTLAQAVDGVPADFAPEGGNLLISGSMARTPELAVGSVPFEVPFEWEDRLGLADTGGFRVRIDAMRDAVPTVYLQGIDRQKAMLPEETAEFEVLAEDDFGVREVGIEWSGQATRPTAEPPAKGELKLADGGPEEQRLGRPAAFSPAAFGILPQKLTLRAFTEDFYPKRGRIYSEPVTIYVLTRDEHAQMLKSRFDRNITEFEDLARRELELLDENERLDKLEGDELQKEENTKRLENQTEAEAESARRMEELTERMEELMKDSARNGEIEKGTLKKMAESMKSMQELSQKDLPEIEDKLGDSKEQSNAPEQTKKDVAEAVEKQQAAVEKMQEAIKKANDANRDFEAGTFVNRLKKAASEQNGIASALIDAFEKLLGVQAVRLDPSDKRRLDETAGQQAKTASDVRWLQDDLGNYFARTKKDSFKEILDEMRKSEVDSGLEKVRSLLEENHSYVATEDAKKWADQLTAWAKKLEGEKDKDGGGGGGGGGGPSPEDQDFEFMLRVMKLVQQEQDLRGQTRALEQLRRDAAQPPANQPKP